jgi:hypothetical protein
MLNLAFEHPFYEIAVLILVAALVGLAGLVLRQPLITETEPIPFRWLNKPHLRKRRVVRCAAFLLVNNLPSIFRRA